MPIHFARRALVALTAVAALVAATPSLAEEVVNLYSSRHYDTDERLYSDFTAATGITVNRIEAEADELIERMKAEGANSPADVFLTVDAGRLHRADEAGLFRPTASAALDAAIPAELRHPNGHWFGFSTRARIIFYDKARVSEPPTTYAALADPKYKGMVCTRSSGNIYMLSLLGSIISREGRDAAKAWAAGVWANRARDPKGGDTDQLRALVSGECAIAVANTYYFARALATDVKDLSAGVDKIGWVFPNQGGTGAHVNVSGGGVAVHAPNPDNAVRFLEYLASPRAQQYFAEGNYEYPVIAGVTQSAVLDRLGAFESDELPIAELGVHQAEAQAIYDEVGYE